MRSVTLKQLRALAAVERTGAITAAAGELAVTPPAVTAQIQLLERIVGLPVLERVGATFRPTVAGRELLDAAARIEQALAECGGALAALKSLDTGQVSVGVVSTAKYFAPHALAAFARANPRIDLKLVVGNRAEIIAGLERLDLDVAIMGRPPEELDVEAEAIGEHPHVVVADPAHPLAGRRAIPAAVIARERLISREDGSGTRALTERLFDSLDERPRYALEMGSNETIKQAVIAGLGISLISAHTVAAEVADGRLSILDVTGLPIIREWYVVRMRGKRFLPAARRLHAFLKEEANRFLPVVPGLQRATPQPAPPPPRPAREPEPPLRRRARN
jgi:DNA-binding transcriptional LysR family regulator